MSNKDSLICEKCGVAYIVKHIITEYQKYEDSRIKHQISLQIGESLGPDLQSSINIL